MRARLDIPSANNCVNSGHNFTTAQTYGQMRTSVYSALTAATLPEAGSALSAAKLGLRLAARIPKRLVPSTLLVAALRDERHREPSSVPALVPSIQGVTWEHATDGIPSWDADAKNSHAQRPPFYAAETRDPVDPEGQGCEGCSSLPSAVPAGEPPTRVRCPRSGCATYFGFAASP